MSSKLEIVETLKESLKSSCLDAWVFSGDETALIDAEYLVTVSAAKAIAALNNSFGFPYKIRLEHCTKEFATACTPQFARVVDNSSLRPRLVTRSRNNTKRSGRIDVAVYDFFDNPLCAIEVKGVNPSGPQIIKDLVRNSNYFEVTSPTGSSTLYFTAFIAIHRYKNVWNSGNAEKKRALVEQRYQKYLKETPKLNSIKHNIEAFLIRKGTPPNPNDLSLQEVGLQGDEDYLYIGVVVSSEPLRKPIDRSHVEISS